MGKSAGAVKRAGGVAVTAAERGALAKFLRRG